MNKNQITSAKEKKWEFFRAGGVDQVQLDNVQDLLAIDQLDQKLWVALACPVDNVCFDKRILSMLDSDKDGRIRANDLITAVKWAGMRLADPEDMIKEVNGISPAGINGEHDCGKKLQAAVNRSLSLLGKKEDDRISIDDIQSIEKTLSENAFNGDAIITEDASSDNTLKSCIHDIIGTIGAVTDRSGKPGINSQNVAAFFEKAVAYVEWLKKGEALSVKLLGNETASAAAAFIAVQEKVDDYFTRCKMADYDVRSLKLLNGNEDDLTLIGKNIINEANTDLAHLPVAPVKSQAALLLTDKINPSWVSRIGLFHHLVVEPLLGAHTLLTEDEWKSIKNKFVPWIGWQAEKPATELDEVAPEKLGCYLSAPVKESLLELIKRDEEESATYNSITDIERLIRYQRDLHKLCLNFVNFRNFYADNTMAIFQAGTLYIDRRSCVLCIRIDDVNKHCTLAAMAGMYLIYCECRRTADNAKMTIVGAVTSGDSDNLMVGRNGVFYDRDNKDWDATIVKIIENPISIRQAFWLPYKSFVRMLETQIAKRASVAEAKSTDRLAATAESITQSDIKDNNGSKPAQPAKIDIGTVAALGVAAGALGTFIATFMGYAAGVIKLGPLAIAGAIIGLLLIISGPSVILAYIKLQKRNIGPLLDAGGWAINAKARVNGTFGEMLTRVAVLPPGSQRHLVDPYAEKKSPLIRLLIAAVFIYIAFSVLNHFGCINEWTHGRFGKNCAVSVEIKKGK